MMADKQQSLSDSRVAISRLPSPSYDNEGDLAKALLRVSEELGWADTKRGAFGNFITPGSRVLIKPNFVLHENEGDWGMEPMVTHPSLIRAVVDAALQSEAEQVLVGDAPVQRCDFDELLHYAGMDDWAKKQMAQDGRFSGIRDFRRTVCVVENGVRKADEDKLPLDRFVLFDLGAESLLEPISNDKEPFRVTCYDPRLMAKTHAPGQHQYLVAKEVMEADVIINLPKLKTHKKAGITCALKNLIGINGNKEYLPHHRIGGAAEGGDCYPGARLTKKALEYALDRQNMAASGMANILWHQVATNLTRVLHLTGDEYGVEGSWSGNDTIWRTCLDLNRILLYGRTDGTLAKEPQRRAVHLVDAVIAGQGDGPLAPQPLPLGYIFAGCNAAAVDTIGAHLLGYDPERLPVVRHAFDDFLYPLTTFGISDVKVIGVIGTGSADEVMRGYRSDEQVLYPAGWRDAARRGDSRLTVEANYQESATRSGEVMNH